MILLREHGAVYASSIVTELKQVLNVAKSQSFIIPESKINAVNKLIKKLKYRGLWERFDDFWLGAYNDNSSLNFSRISLKKAGISTPGTSLIYNEKGWKGNGAGTGDFKTNLLYTSLSKMSVGNSNLTTVVNDTADVTSISDALISSAQTNSQEIWFAYNSNLQRQLSTGNLSANADLSGVGFKTFSKIGENCTLFNKNVQTLRTQANAGIPAQDLVLLRNSTTRYSKLGLSMFSIGGNLVGLEMIYRDILNEYLTEIGLTAFA